MEEANVKTVLLADDDSDDRELFEDALHAVCPEYKLNTAKNGLDVLDLLWQSDVLPDLIFLDLNMPLKDGYSCLIDIKSTERIKHIPVIIFSTSLDLETAKTVYKNGASLYVVKPNSFLVLKAIIKKVLSLNLQAPLSKESFIFQI